MDIKKVCTGLRAGSRKLALQTAAEKNKALEAVAEALDKNRSKIFEANKKDIEKGRAGGMSESLIDRLMLNDSRLDGVISSLRTVIAQTDPIGEEVAGWKTPNGLTIRQVRVPLGVVSIIYESRPNVTVDAFCLAYKSGNAILLRGSSSAYNSNKAIVQIIKQALEQADAGGQTPAGVPEAIELVDVIEHDHSDVDLILNAVGLIDVVLPRGGKKLIQNVVRNARVPVIETGSGVCHLYVDKYADLDMAARVAENAKIQRPSVCNACECIVIHKDVAADFIPKLADKFNGKVKVHCDEKSYELFNNVPRESFNKADIVKAEEDDYGMEFLDYECCVKIVDSIEDAVSYINSHNTKHSESIITENRHNAGLFQQTIDASCVYVNASTRFTDGGEFGFGAELGISTQKLHARGPMGIKALTTTKYLIDGDGQVRG